MSMNAWQKFYIYFQKMPVHVITLILQEMHHRKELKQFAQSCAEICGRTGN